jgi:hypothetical protein
VTVCNDLIAHGSAKHGIVLDQQDAHAPSFPNSSICDVVVFD